MLVKYYQLTEDELKTKPLEEGSLYLITDTNRFYLDPVGGGERTLISANPIVFSTELERENLLSPISNKLYFVTESSTIYIYHNDMWHGYREPVQSDWNQTDENELDYIKNKPEIAADKEIIDMLIEENMFMAVKDSDGAMLTDENGKILLW